MTIIEATKKLKEQMPGHFKMFRPGGREMTKLSEDTLQQLHPMFSHMTDVDFSIEDILAEDWSIKL